MITGNGRGFWWIPVSLLLAMILSVVPVPAGMDDFRPQWVTLAVIFWCLTRPDRVGVFWAFWAGLILDTLTGSLLGQQALGLSVVAYLTAVMQSRLRLFPLWQQSVFVWVLLLVERLLTLWVLGATGQPVPPIGYWIPTLVGLLIWPLVAVLLTAIGRRTGTV